MKQVEREVQKLLKQYGGTFPVDVEKIAKDLGIEVQLLPLEDDTSGMLVIKDGHASIALNKAHHPNRRRFTLAHEIAHFKLHAKNASVFIEAKFFRDTMSSTGRDSWEVDANNFAAELLMPKELLENEIVTPIDPVDELTVRRLATRFGVSPQAVTVRLATLGLMKL